MQRDTEKGMSESLTICALTRKGFAADLLLSVYETLKTISGILHYFGFQQKWNKAEAFRNLSLSGESWHLYIIAEIDGWTGQKS